MKYAVMDIGCLCCYEPTVLVTVTDLAGVRRLNAKLDTEIADWGYAVGLVAYPLPEPT